MAVNLFDVNFYRAANPDLASLTDAQAWQHFQANGLNEGRKFSPFVSLEVYRTNNPDLKAAGLISNQQLYDHLRTNGVAEGRQFSPFVDINYYLAVNPDVNQAFSGNKEQAFNHLRTNGVAEGRQFSPFVDINYYLAVNPDVNQAYGGNRVLALQHLELVGLKEGRKFISTFNTNFYKTVHPDLAAAGLSNQQLLTHFQSNGLREGLASSESFNVKVYLANNSDLRAAGLNNQLAYEHFLKSGQREGRPGADYAGNTISAARSIGISSSTSTFTDFVGYGDANDYYRFSLNSASNFNLVLNGLAANANVNLLNSSGQVLHSSSSSGTEAESINRILDLGTYYLQVYQYSGSSNYNLNLAATAIPYITIAGPNGANSNATEGAIPGQFTITRTGSTANALTVYYSVAGTATNNIDYTNLTGSILIPAGQSSITVPINVIDDSLPEGTETIILSLTSSSAYTLGSTATSTVSLYDNEPAARDLGTLSGLQTISDSISSANPNDYYRFALSDTRSVSLLLNGMTGDANVQLLDSNGNVLHSPTNYGSQVGANTGTTVEAISRLLNAGTYYIRVLPGVAGTTTSYSLSLLDTSSSTSFTNRVIELTNFYRTQSGLSTLTNSSQLSSAAQAHSQDMAFNDFYSHTGSNGSTAGGRFTTAGYQWSMAAENIYASPSNPETAIEGWMFSSGHRSNILNSSLRDIGVGYYYLPNDTGNVNWNHYWTQNFGAPISQITLSSPNGGETFQAGSSYNITWTDNISENVKLDLYKAGVYYSTINSSTLSDGSELWAVPTNLPSGSDYQIRIASTTNGTLYDFGNSYFTVSPASFVTLSSPNGGETFQAGLNYNITWTDNITENVKLDLYKAGVYYSTINSSTLSDGSELWAVPTNLPSASDYQIRIASTTNNNIFDYSDRNFTLQSDLKKYWFYYNFNANNYSMADSYSGSVIAPVGMYTVTVADGSYLDSELFDPRAINNEIGLNGKYVVHAVEDYNDSLTNEAGRVFVHDYIDRDNGAVQHFTPYKYTQGVQPSGLNYLGSELDHIDSARTSGTQFGQDYYEADPEASNWRAEYYNNRNLSGSPVFIESFGSSQNFERQWGSDSPTTRLGSTAVPTDSFSARVTSTRYLAPGLYQVRVGSDDGVRVKVGNLNVIDSWVDQGPAPHSGYFRWAGGTTPITVEYYENAGLASLKFELMPATPFQDAVDEATQWRSTVHTWDRNQSGTPPLDFYTNDAYKIGGINLGSNTRSDGQKGIKFDLGNGALNADGSRLPDDFFAVRSYTWADFDGGPYKFRVQGDDGFQISAKSHATGQWYYITPQNEWTPAYGALEKEYTLPSGRYDLHFHYFEQGIAANFDLSWAKVSNPDIDIQVHDVYGSFTAFQTSAIQQAVENWERILTKDKDITGSLKIALTEGFTAMGGESWGGAWAEAFVDPAQNSRSDYSNGYGADGRYREVDIAGGNYHNRINYNSYKIDSLTKNELVRLTMHEIGHTLGLDHESGYSLMNTSGLNESITPTSWSTLGSLGYNFNQNAPVYWS
ncbi:MAG: pre-peptidase C-terminal domain-containing protein [Trichocoleus desertorum ATA4-8-CV12]|jgi:uncharacterized protein YkwD|nr:pre-peptidase C-terminal domain-containing protein [Trichocoleus desertorum ATA4-8-CV12]